MSRHDRNFRDLIWLRAKASALACFRSPLGSGASVHSLRAGPKRQSGSQRICGPAVANHPAWIDGGKSYHEMVTTPSPLLTPVWVAVTETLAPAQLLPPPPPPHAPAPPP
jgi:hypothetical protein